MFKRLKRVVCAAAAAVVMAAVSVTAAADHTYQLDGDGLCDEILASSQEINGTEGTFETSFSSENRDNYVSLRFKLFNEFLDPEFWNDDSVTVSVEVKLETEGVDIIGCIPAFNAKWNWIDPSGYTNLKYGEWVTVSEKGTHFYPDFSSGDPGYLLFQARNNWGKEAPGLVKVSVRNFRITGGAAEQTAEPPETTTPAEVTTASAEDTAPVETDPAVPAETDPAAPEEIDPVTAENVPGTAEITQEITAENTAENTAEISGEDKPTAEASAPEEPAQTTTSTPQTTTIVTQATAATSERIDYNSMYEAESPVKMIVVIVVIAAVVSVGAVVGYLIYKKKKYY